MWQSLLLVVYAAIAAAIKDFGNDKTALEQHCKEHDEVLVLFYADWCHHCKNFEPIVARLEKSHDYISFAKFNAGNDRKVGALYVNDEYPGLAYWQNGTFFAHALLSSNSWEGLIAWVDQYTGKLVEHFPNRELAEKRASSFRVPFLVSIRDDADYELVKDFAFNNRQKGKFLVYNGTELRISVKHWGEVEHSTTLSTKEDLATFVEKYSFPLFGPVDKANQHLYFFTGKDPVIIFGTVKEITPYLTEIRKAALKLLEKYAFMWVNTDPASGSRVNVYSMGISKFPAAMTVTGGRLNPRSMKRYIYPSTNLTSTLIVPWVNDVAEGRIRPNVRSTSSRPNDRAFTPVKLEWVTADHFEEQVFHADSDFVLILTAPSGSQIFQGCTNCEAALTLADKLAQKLETDTLKFGEMMVTVNEIPLSDPKWAGNWTLADLPVAYFIKAGDMNNFTQWESKTVLNPVTLLAEWAKNTERFKLEAESAADKISTELTLDKSEKEVEIRDEL